MKKQFSLFIPYEINYSIIEIKSSEEKFVFLYNDTYFFSFNFNSTNLFINKDTNIIKIELQEKNDNSLGFKNELNKFIFSWEHYFYSKIKFTGKGFKWKKKQTNIFLFFNRAHKCFFVGTNIILRRLSKSKMIILKNNYKNVRDDALIIRKVRALNIFTKRGLRLSRQIVYKKKGKTSTH